MAKTLMAFLLPGASAHMSLSDCRNETTEDLGGNLVTMSYHIHYTTDKVAAYGDMKVFYEGFVEKFADYFDQSELQCPFGPNYGAYSSDTWPAKTICSLEGALEFELQSKTGADYGGNPWGNLYQRAFFVPVEYIDEAWEWTKENRGLTDAIKHPNTGCMHDDHGLRPIWEGTEHTITTLEFPCNVPTTGCQDNDYFGPPFCGCTGPLVDDAPENSCKNCVAMGELPPTTIFT